MSPWRPSPEFVARSGPGLLRLLGSTWRTERLHHDRYLAVHGPRVILLWHEMLLPLLWLHRNEDVAVVVSQARDGRYLSLSAQRLGYHPIEGSSSRGGVQAMKGVIRALEDGRTVALTPDGPLGPRRVLKPATVEAAQRTGAVVQVAVASARKCRRMASWDQFMIPSPGTRLRFGYSEAQSVAPGPEGLHEAVRRVTTAFRTLEEETAWRGAAKTIA